MNNMNMGINMRQGSTNALGPPNGNTALSGGQEDF